MGDPHRSYWNLPSDQALQLEAHSGSRVTPCFASRPSGIAAMLHHAVRSQPQAEALVDGSRRWTWAELFETSTRIANGLNRLGVERGDRVALLMGNCAEFVLAFYAIAERGAVTVPLSTRDSARGVAFILAQCSARAVVVQADLLHLLPAQNGSADAPPQIICCRADDANPLPAMCLTPWPDLLTPHVGQTSASDTGPSVSPGVQGETARAPTDETDETDENPAIILYTSGTTGQPKGAVITHRNVVHSALHYKYCLGLSSGERAVLAVPGSHVTGLIAIVAAMGAVAGCVIVLREFKASPFLQLASAERMSYTLMVPAMYALCLRDPGIAACDLSAWRLGGFGGAPMPVTTIEQLARHCPGIRLFNAYGATETTSPATLTPPGSPVLDAVGVAVPCASVIIMDEDGKELPAGESGEVWIAGPMVVPGYWDNPQATADSFYGGYWKSGDIGTLDAAGFLRVHDRKKDMINRGGYKVFSVEVENCLMSHPDVLEAAVVGVPCPVLGERVHAFVRVSADLSAAKSESDLNESILTVCRRDLADYKVPETLSMTLAPLPRNANGKLLKRELRAQLASPA
jgi:long-chain acyl-CoA synthetase